MPWEMGTWWLVGAAAMFMTVLSVGLRQLNPMALFMFSGLSLFIWLVWAINAFAVVETTQAGIQIIHEFPSLGYLGFVLAMVMALDLLAGIISAFKQRGNTNAT